MQPTAEVRTEAVFTASDTVDQSTSTR